MYNEKVKADFLSKIPVSTAKTYRSYFGKLENYEIKLNKDILFFSKEEFVDLMKDITGLSMGSSLYTFVDCLRRYGKWYSENYAPIDYKSIFTIDYLQITPKYYTSSERLLEDIDLIIRDKTSKLNIPLDKAARQLKNLRLTYNIPIGVILLSWCGLSEAEIVNLKSENIFTEEKSIYIESRDTVISVEPPVMAILGQIKSGKTYAKFEKKNQDEYEIKVKEFQYTEFFLKKREAGRKGDYNSPISQNLVRLAIRDFNENSYNKTFSFTKLRENGMFYRAYKKQKSMPELKFREGKDTEDYYKIFDNWTKEISMNRLKDLKYKYRAYAKMMEE